MKKRVLAWLLALTMMLTLLPLGVFAGATSNTAYGRSVAARMDNAEALLFAYDIIEKALDSTPEVISVAHSTYKLTFEELCTAYDLVRSDHPEVFWHAQSYSLSMSNGYAVALKPKYTMTGAALEAAKAALEAEVVRLTAGLEGKSDYEKSVILHDRVAAECSYVFGTNDQNAYGALVENTAVCAGYAHAYQLLMQRAGIPIWYVTGDSISPAGEIVGHAWNLVQLDGEWYYTDVTWDDQTSYTYYAYLNVTTEQISEDHFFGDYAEYLPFTAANANNFFIRNELWLETFDLDTVVRALRDYTPSRLYITGDKKAFLDAVSHNLWDVMEALNAPPGAVSYRYSSLGREVILKISVAHECAYVAQRVEPTCVDAGYTVEICKYDGCHNERNRVELPATGQHVYENACATMCLTCGLVRETEGHVYQYPCSTRCQECGALRQEEAVHEHAETVITPATCGKQGMSRFTCIYCGDSFTMITPMTLQHVYDNDCDKECNACGTWRTVAGHSYDNDCDDTCNSCGYVRGIGGHVYDGSCDADCNLCGAVREDAAHAYDNDCDADCNDCGFTRTAPHAYDDDQDADCNVCGTVREVVADSLVIYGTTDNTQLTRGDTVTLTVMIKNNPGLVGWRVYVGFDESVLELVNQTGDAKWSNTTFGPQKSPANVMFSDTIHPDVEGDGAMFTLTFRVREDAAFGTSLLDVYVKDPNDFFDRNWSVFEIGTVDTDVVVSDHTHTYDGVCDGACNVCGFARDAEEHTYDNACDAACNGCGLVREVKPHPYTVKVVEPTCENEGVKTSVCSICGHTVVESIPALGHDYTVTVFDPDCVNDGYTLHSCNRCRYSYTDEIVPALGHKPGAPADCENAQTCTVCGVELTPALGHDYDAVVTAPTCTADGYTTHTCANCGDTYVDSTVTALGHQYDNACDPTCNTCGEVREVGDHVYDHDYDPTCNECGDVREIPVMPGDVNDDGTVNVRDYGLLQQYLNGWNVTIVEVAANVNGDSTVNVRDLGLLQQYLNGWDVTLK